MDSLPGKAADFLLLVDLASICSLFCIVSFSSSGYSCRMLFPNRNQAPTLVCNDRLKELQVTLLLLFSLALISTHAA